MSPWAPRRPCPAPNCAALLAPGQRRCAVHAGDYDRSRGPGRQFYGTPRWRAFRAWFLLNHPVCVTEGCGADANEVDHVLGRRERPDLAFDEDNCRAMCKSCHSRRTLTDQGPNSRGGIKSPGSADIQPRASRADASPSFDGVSPQGLPAMTGESDRPMNRPKNVPRIAS